MNLNIVYTSKESNKFHNNQTSLQMKLYLNKFIYYKRRKRFELVFSYIHYNYPWISFSNTICRDLNEFTHMLYLWKCKIEITAVFQGQLIYYGKLTSIFFLCTTVQGIDQIYETNIECEIDKLFILRSCKSHAKYTRSIKLFFSNIKWEWKTN